MSAAEGVRAAVLANAGIAIASEWMFAPEIKDGTIKIVLRGWTLPQIDLWAVFPPDEQPLKPAVLRSVAAEIHAPCRRKLGLCSGGDNAQLSVKNLVVTGPQLAHSNLCTASARCVGCSSTAVSLFRRGKWPRIAQGQGSAATLPSP